MDITFDAPSVDELKLILDSWSNSFRKSPFAGCVPNNEWARISRATATQLMCRPRARTIVALSPSNDGNRGRAMGYIVGEPGILHWVYTKKSYRRLGIGKALLNELTKDWDVVSKNHPRYTHRTERSVHFLPPGWKWDPVAARIKV